MLKKFSVNSTTFIFLISGYFAFVLNAEFWRKCLEIIKIVDSQNILFLISLPIFMLLALYWLFNILTVKYIGKPIIIFLLLCSSVAAYAMHYLGIEIDAEMIGNIIETNPREAKDLITGHGLLFVFLTGVIPALLVVFVKIKYQSFCQELKKRLAYWGLSLIPLIVLAPMTYKTYVAYGRNNPEIRRSVNTFNYISAANRYRRRAAERNMKFQILDESPRKMTASSGNPRVMILVIGETARADNFSLYGYAKDTNPLLSQQQDLIVFKDVTACGTSTSISIPCLFAATSRKSFDKIKSRHIQNLMDIIKLSGYDTVWIDNDDGCKYVCTRIEYANMQNTKSPDCFGDYCYDGVFLKDLENRLAQITKDSVLVLHTMGSHGPTYYKRYPAEFKKFTPECSTADLQKCTQEEIINTYDNTIGYTDYILASIIDILKQYNNLSAGMLYVSDHGESLGENGIYLHAFPYKTAPDVQKKVPMILWLSPQLKQELSLDEKMVRKRAAEDKFSHDNFYHSVLHLLNIDTTTYNPALDIFAK